MLRVEDHVRRDRSEDDRVEIGRDDRPARREAVGGGTGRGRDDEGIGRVRGEQSAAEVYAHAGLAVPRQLLQYHVVDRRHVQSHPQPTVSAEPSRTGGGGSIGPRP